MSFLVVFNFDRAAIDQDRLRRMQPEIMAWSVQLLGGKRQVAFVTSKPGSDPEAAHCAALDACWLIGRVRLDGRDELRSAIPEISEQESDAVLCLRTYQRWGSRCLEHLRGDFCFVLWDEDRQRLFCARDQLGVRPLFYAVARTSVFVSDSLDSITAEAPLSSDLDDYWIADFLTSRICMDPDRTVYKHIKRVPPGHFLAATASDCVVRRYWQLRVDDPIYYRKRSEYIDHFQEVLTLAIKDRLPPDRVGISMSGGIDSPTLAAHTVSITGDPARVVAYTQHFEHLIPDQEKHFAALVANRLGIPLTLRAADDCRYDPHWYARQLRTPEPTAQMVRAVPLCIVAAEMAKQAQVWFWGEGPDDALAFEWQAYLRWLLKIGDWRQLGIAMFRYAISKHAKEWISTLRKYGGRHSAARTDPRRELPQWLSEAFVKEMDLVARARQSSESRRADQHPWHPRAIRNLTSSNWPHLLETLDSAISCKRLTWRHPYLDLRVLTFLLSVPPIPWARRKRLIREAMRGVLPDEVLRRDKTPLTGSPLEIMLRRCGLPPLSPSGPISRYIDQGKVPTTLPTEPLMHPLINVHVLDHWLQAHRRKGKDATTSTMLFL